MNVDRTVGCIYEREANASVRFIKEGAERIWQIPVSDLRNYNEVLKNCHKGEPVYLTKNGRGRFVVMDIEDYERDRAEKKLLLKLQEAEEAVKDGEGWLDLDELKALVGE